MKSQTESNRDATPRRTPIEKSEGVTDTEKYLARLCQRNFLSLWSYPGVFRDQGKKGNGDGKEICDLLVVFDKHILIFSDKHCHVQDSGNVQLDWQRWFRKAIQKSAEQAWGAERWIRQQPNRVFLDRECKHALPIDLSLDQETIFHLVVVSHGISSRIATTFPGSSGSLFLDTAIKGFDNHQVPFAVGDVDPERTFVHVFDDDSLHTVMSVRDTIFDFVAYLAAREKLFRGQRQVAATGEEQLLAIYLKNLNEKQEHDFVFPIAADEKVDRVYVPEGHWEEFQKAPERIAQLNADKISYAWDDLIEKCNFYALRGEQYFVTSGGLKDSERVLRFMAREPRWKRRLLAETIIDILHTTPIDQRRLQVIQPIDKGDPYYIFLLLPTLHAKTDDEYRTVRRHFLEGCCIVAKLQYPQAKDIVGIATEPGVKNTRRSEDYMYLDAREWSAEHDDRAKEIQAKLGILQKPRRIKKHFEEYPSVPVAGAKMKNPRNKPCPCGSRKKFKKCCGA